MAEQPARRRLPCPCTTPPDSVSADLGIPSQLPVIRRGRGGQSCQGADHQGVGTFEDRHHALRDRLVGPGAACAIGAAPARSLENRPRSRAVEGVGEGGARESAAGGVQVKASWNKTGRPPAPARVRDHDRRRAKAYRMPNEPAHRPRTAAIRLMPPTVTKNSQRRQDKPDPTRESEESRGRAMLLLWGMLPEPMALNTVATAKKTASHLPKCHERPRSRSLGNARSMKYIGPPAIRPWSSLTRYLCEMVTSTNLVVIPTKAVAHIQSAAGRRGRWRAPAAEVCPCRRSRARRQGLEVRRVAFRVQGMPSEQARPRPGE